MAETCLRYLNLEAFRMGPVHGEDEDSQFEDRIKGFPFFEYASIFWGQHARTSEDDGVFQKAYEFVMNDGLRNASIQAIWFSSDASSVKWRSRSRHHASPLQVAIHFDYTQLASHLLESGTDVDIKDDFGMTPLMWATQAGNIEIIRKILHMQVSVNARDDKGRNALHIAIDFGHQEVAILLIEEQETDINTPADLDQGGMRTTPLISAVTGELLKVVQRLLARPDVLVNCQDAIGRSAVCWACMMRNSDITKALVAVPGIDMEHPCSCGLPPLIAAAGGDVESVKHLLAAGANINVRENHLGENGTALMRAAICDEASVVVELIEQGIDWRAKDNFHRNAVHSAAYIRSARALAALLKIPDIDINLRDVFGNSPLHGAAELRYSTLVLEMLLAEGAAIDIHNSRGETALDAARARGTRKSILLLEKMYAQKFALPVISTISPSLAESSLIQAVRQEDEILLDSLLCSRGDRSSIDLEERDDWFGRTPLLHAALVGHLSILRKLCSAGANIHAQDVKGLTALHIAATMDLFPMALYLLREGADAATEDYRGLDALSGAKTISLQVLLLEYGAPIRHFHDLRTLLFLTAKHGSMKVVQRLVQAGAYGHLKDRYGRSAYGEAKRAGRTDVARYLFKMGGSKAGSSSQSHTSSILPSPNDTVEKHASETRACTSSLDGESDIVRRDHDHMLLVADISQTSSAEPEASDKAREQTQEQPAMQAPPISKRSVPTLAFPRNTAYINVLFVVVLFTLYLDGYHLLLRALSMV